MILPIVAYGHPVLKAVAKDIDKDIDKDYPDLEKLLADMWVRRRSLQYRRAQ